MATHGLGPQTGRERRNWAEHQFSSLSASWLQAPLLPPCLLSSTDWNPADCKPEKNLLSLSCTYPALCLSNKRINKGDIYLITWSYDNSVFNFWDASTVFPIMPVPRDPGAVFASPAPGLQAFTTTLCCCPIYIFCFLWKLSEDSRTLQFRGHSSVLRNYSLSKMTQHLLELELALSSEVKYAYCAHQDGLKT